MVKTRSGEEHDWKNCILSLGGKTKKRKALQGGEKCTLLKTLEFAFLKKKKLKSVTVGKVRSRGKGVRGEILGSLGENGFDLTKKKYD